MALSVGELFATLKLDSRGFEQGLAASKQSLQAVDSNSQKARGAISQLGSAMSSVGKLAAGFVVAQVAIGGMSKALDFGKQAIFGYNNTLQQSNIAFTTMLGSAGKAQSMLAQLQQFANTSPFELPDVLLGSQRLMAMGVSAEQVIPLLKDIGNVSSGLGAGSEGINNITRAIGQMNASVVLHTEDLNQLVDVGVPVWDILSEATGMTVQQARKAVEQGEIASSTFIKAFHDFASIKYGDMMSAQSKTFEGAMSTVRDVSNSLVSTAFKPLFDGATEVANALGNFLQTDTVRRWAEEFASGLGRVISGLRDFFTSLDTKSLDGFFESIAARLDAFATDMFGGGYNAAKTFAQGMVDGAAQFVTQAIDFITGMIASYLIGHSPTEEGPLSEIDKGGQAVMEAYVGGMKDGAGGAQEVAGDIADSFAAVGDNAADADGHVRDLTGTINDLRDQQDTIKNQIEDIERGYQSQIDPLEEQLDALKDIVDIQREQEALAISLEQSEIKRAITAAKGDPVERARLQAQLDAIQQQQEENRLTEQAAKLKEDAATAGLKAQQEQLAFRKEEIRIAERQQSLMEDAAKGKDISADLAELDIQRQQLAIKKQLAESKSGRDATASKQRDLELQQQENALKQQLNGLTDKGAIAELEQRKGVLDARKDEIDAQKEQEDLQRKMAALPLEQRIKELKAAQEDATQPLKDQQELLSRRQDILESEKRKWGEIKSEIAATKEGSKGKGGAKGAGGGGLNLPSGGPIEGIPTQAIEEGDTGEQSPAAKAGESLATGLMNGMGQYIQDHIGKIIGGAAGAGIGRLAGGMLGTAFGPVGTIVGGLLGGLIGQGVQDELAKHGIDVSTLFGDMQSQLGPVIASVGEFATDVAGFFTDYIIPAVQRVANDIFPILRDRWNEIYPEILETIDRLEQGFQQFGDFIVPIIEGAWNTIVPIIDGGAKIITGIIRLLLNVIQLDWGGAWDAIKAILDGAWTIIKTVLGSSLGDIKQSALDAWDKLKTTADEWWEKIKTAVTTPIKDAASWLDGKWEDVKKAADGAWSWIKTQADTWWGDIKSAVTGPIDSAKTTLDTTWENLKTKATDTWDGIKTYINDHKQEMIDVLKAPFQWLQDNVGDFLKNAANTVITKLNTAGSSIGGFVANAGKALNTIFTAIGLGAQFSESNPWRDIPGLATGGSVVEGGLTKVGEKGTELLWLPPGAKVIPHDPTEKILSGVDSGPMHAVGGPGDVGKSILSGVKSVASSAFDTITSWVKQGADWVVGQAFGNLGVGLDLPGLMSSLGSAVFGKVKTASIEMVKTVLDGLAAGGDWVKPLLSYLVTQEFGPASGALGYSFHTGIDMAAPAGSSVRAAKGGRVASAGWNDGYGNAIILEHANNLRTLYGHLQSILVGIGDMVRSGQTIGLEGSTGNSTGPHLHFETMQNGARVNPRTFIPALANGAVLTSPTLALLAETARAQPEIVTPERLMRQVVREELGSLLGGGAGGPINITVQSVLDGRVVGESVAPTVVNWMGRDYMRRAPRR